MDDTVDNKIENEVENKDQFMTKQLPVVKELKEQELSHFKSRLSIIPFSVLLKEHGDLNSLSGSLEFLEQRLEQLIDSETSQESSLKEISMLQQVISWIKMGSIL